MITIGLVTFEFLTLITPYFFGLLDVHGMRVTGVVNIGARSVNGLVRSVNNDRVRSVNDDWGMPFPGRSTSDDGTSFTSSDKTFTCTVYFKYY